MTDSNQHSVQNDLALIRAALGHPSLPAYAAAVDRLEEQIQSADTRELQLREAWKKNVEDLAHQYGEVVRGLEEQLETLRDVLTEADDQLALENEKHPNHNITLVRQRIASVASWKWGDPITAKMTVSNPASSPSIYEGTPKPHGLDCRCADCLPASERP